MKTALPALLTVLIFSLSLPAHSFQSRLSHLGIGVKGDLNMSRAPNDVLFGLAVNTPYLFSRVAVRGTVYQGFYRGIPVASSSSNELWMGYTAASGGIVIALTEETKVGRPYTEFGWIGILPHPQFTDSPYAWGVYGVLGMDFLFGAEDFFGIFLEAGARGMMTGGTAELIRKSPVYGSGIILTIGVRFFL